MADFNSDISVRITIEDGNSSATIEGVKEKLDEFKATINDSADAAPLEEVSKAVQKVGESYDEQTSRLHEMVQASLAEVAQQNASIQAGIHKSQVTDEERAALEKLKAAASSYTQEEMNARGARLMDSEAKVKSAEASKQESDALDKQRAALSKMVGSIDPVAQAYTRLDEKLRILQEARKSGLVSDEDYTTWKAGLDKVRDSIGRTSSAQHEFSLNNAMTRRELGYLAKDLLTGQWNNLGRSFSTLVVNSGVLTKVFRGLRGEVTGLAEASAATAAAEEGMATATAAVGTTAEGAAAGVATLEATLAPFIAIAAAIAAVVAVLGTLGLAAFKHGKDIEALNAALIKTGQGATATADQLNEAANVAGATTGRYGDARKAVLALADSGQNFGASMGAVAVAAVRVAKVTGQSIDEVVADIGKLSKDPIAAITELDDKYKFLTATQYEQIKALQDEGRTRDAARLSYSLYTSEMADRAKEVEDNANWMVRSAHSVGEAWNKAWTAIKNSFDNGLGAQATQLETIIEQLRSKKINITTGNYEDPSADDLRKANALSVELAAINKKRADNGIAENQRFLDKSLQEEKIAVDKATEQYVAPLTKFQNRLNEIGLQFAVKLNGKTGEAANAVLAERARALKQAADTYTAAIRADGTEAPDVKPKKVRDTSAADAKRLEAANEQIRKSVQSIAAVQSNFDNQQEQKSNPIIEKAIALQHQLDDARSKAIDVINKSKGSEDVKRAGLAELAKQYELTTAAIDKYKQRLLQDAQDKRANDFGKELKRIEDESKDKAGQALSRLDDEYLKFQLLMEDAGVGPGTEAYDRAMAAWNAYHKHVMDSLDEEQKQADQFAVQAARTIQSQIGSALESVFDGTTDSWRASLAKLLRQMVAQIIAAKLSNYLFGDFGKDGKVGGVAGNLVNSLVGLFAKKKPEAGQIPDSQSTQGAGFWGSITGFFGRLFGGGGNAQSPASQVANDVKNEAATTAQTTTVSTAMSTQTNAVTTAMTTMTGAVTSAMAAMASRSATGSGAPALGGGGGNGAGVSSFLGGLGQGGQTNTKPLTDATAKQTDAINVNTAATAANAIANLTAGNNTSGFGQAVSYASSLLTLFQIATQIATAAQNAAAAASTVKMLAATGGYISGPGTATSDSIPARLSDGEFVVNAKATSQHLSLLHRINSGRGAPRSGVLHFAAGGMVKSAAEQKSNNSGPSQPIRLINAIDPDYVSSQMGSSGGEKAILNVIGRNSRAIAQQLGRK